MSKKRNNSNHGKRRNFISASLFGVSLNVDVDEVSNNVKRYKSQKLMEQGINPMLPPSASPFGLLPDINEEDDN